MHHHPHGRELGPGLRRAEHPAHRTRLRGLTELHSPDHRIAITEAALAAPPRGAASAAFPSLLMRLPHRSVELVADRATVADRRPQGMLWSYLRWSIAL